MNIDTKILTKYWQAEFNNALKRSFIMTKWGLSQFQHMPINVIYYINRMKDKNYMIMSIDAENPFDKI